MTENRLIRAALWVSVPYDPGAAGLFAFPDTPLAHWAGLPGPAPVLDRVLLAMFAALFAGAYAWLARCRVIDRPLLGFGAIGKALAFLAVVSLWLAGAVPLRGVAVALGDAVLAILFFRWLIRGSRAEFG